MRMRIATALLGFGVLFGCGSSGESRDGEGSGAGPAPAAAPEAGGPDAWVSRLLAGAPAQPGGPAPGATSDDARKLHEEAMAALQRRELDRSVEIYGRILAAKPDDAIALYNLACAQALAGRTVPALDALEKSVRAGYEEADHVEEDSDLASLRSEDRYKALIQGLRNRASGEEISWLPDLP
ncbi:MAG: hypothetical protein MUC63_03900, partial [Planctomycetes bacterium]|nr:hypothetical protein [Planctomycetota bacterium]